MDQRYTWIVRFDVAPLWVADGFVMDDSIARDMLSDRLNFARPDIELQACVLAAPSAQAIAREQGYGPKHVRAKEFVRQVRDGAHLAYQGLADGQTIEGALQGAVNLLNSVAFVRDEGDNTGAVLSQLRDALALIRGDDALPEREAGAEEPHSENT